MCERVNFSSALSMSEYCQGTDRTLVARGFA